MNMHHSPHSAVEQLSELLRGLEAGPLFVASSPQALYALGQAIATQAKQAHNATKLEQVNDRLCERLVMALKHMTREQRDAFEAEWSEFMRNLPADPPLPARVNPVCAGQSTNTTAGERA